MALGAGGPGSEPGHSGQFMAHVGFREERFGCSIRQHKWQRTRQTFTPTGGRAVLAAGKSASGALGLIGGVVAGVQVLIAAGGLILLHTH